MRSAAKLYKMKAMMVRVTGGNSTNVPNHVGLSVRNQSCSYNCNGGSGGITFGNRESDRELNETVKEAVVWC